MITREIDINTAEMLDSLTRYREAAKALEAAEVEMKRAAEKLNAILGAIGMPERDLLRRQLAKG